MYFCKIGTLCVLGSLALPATALASPCDAVSDNTPEVEARLETPLTLSKALKRVRSAGPNIRIAALEGRALAADADQASRRLNPVLSAEIENFAGGGNLSGFGQSEFTVGIEQTLRLGGKRRLTESAARARAALASAQCSVILRETELQAAQLFYTLSASIELSALSDEVADNSDELVESVSLRVEAGAAAPPELARARADAASIRAAAHRAKANVQVSALELASIWGGDSLDFTLPDTRIERSELAIGSMPPTSNEHPLLLAAKAGEIAADAETRLAKSFAIPDVTILAGVRRFEDSGDHAFLAGVSVPFPIFDKNKDGARAARLRADAARLSHSATRLKLQARRSASASRVAGAQRQLETLQNDALPAAHEAYEATVEGYRVGKFDLTTALDARRALINTRRDIIEARVVLQTSTMQLRALFGTPPFAGDMK